MLQEKLDYYFNYFIKYKIIVIILLCLTSCTTTLPKKVTSIPSKTYFIRSSFNQLNDWHNENHEQALASFVNACDKMIQRTSGSNKVGDDVIKWKKVCKTAISLYKSLKGHDNGMKLRYAKNSAKKFFQRNFIPYKVGILNSDNRISFNARFTGYYEIELYGTKHKNKNFPYPIYSLPPNDNLRKLDRKAINDGALQNKGLEIAWVKDAARLYFLHIQGSGVIKLQEGGYLNLSWAGGNGYKFKSLPSEYIGSTLHVIDQLHKNGQKAFMDMNLNPSYVYFSERKTPFVVGAQNSALTQERSAAIDSRIYPYGIPIWIETNLPYVKNYCNGEKYNRILIGQDRGGAIKGGARLDIFFGYGPRAENIASSLNVKGQMYVLYPSSVKVAKIFDI